MNKGSVIKDKNKSSGNSHDEASGEKPKKMMEIVSFMHKLVSRVTANYHQEVRQNPLAGQNYNPV